MIAGALRTEIQRFAPRAPDRARDALMHALATLVECSSPEDPAGRLACHAFAEHVAVELGAPGADRSRVEQALDAIDELVEDPAQLPGLRQALRAFMLRFERQCEETVRLPRRQTDVRISAA